MTLGPGLLRRACGPIKHEAGCAVRSIDSIKEIRDESG